jgi:hypothetical protein
MVSSIQFSAGKLRPGDCNPGFFVEGVEQKVHFPD